MTGAKTTLWPSLRYGRNQARMGFLRTLFWVAVTVVVVVFSTRNWVPVTISLFGDLQADVKLPVLLMIAFLIGFVPLYVWHRLLRWRDRRRMAAERVVPAAPAIVPPPPAEPARFPSASPGIGPAPAD